MKLSDLNPNEVEVVQPSPAPKKSLRLSDLDHKDVEVIKPADNNEIPYDKLLSEKPARNPADKRIDYNPLLEQEQLSKDIPITTSGVRGLIQALSLGGSDELYGGLKALTSGEIDDPTKQLSSVYEKYRNMERNANKQAEKAHPWGYAGGQMVGSLPAAALIPGAGITGGLASGAALGGLQGFGESEAETPGALALDAAQGAGIGGLFGGVLGKAGKMLSPANLEKSAAESAIRAGGATSGERRALMNMSGAGEDSRLVEQGKLLLAENPFQPKAIVTAGAKPVDILERSLDLKEKAGLKIGELLKSLDDTFSVANPTIKKYFTNTDTIKREIENLQTKYSNRLVNPTAPDILPLEITKSQFNTLSGVLKDLDQFGMGPIDFQDAQKLKQLIKSASYSEGKGVDPVMEEVYGIVNREIERAADDTTNAIGKPELAELYKQAKNYYRAASDQIGMSTGQVGRELGHKSLGLTDYIFGSAMAAAHGGPAGVGLLAAKKLSETFGSSVSAVVKNKLAKGIGAVADTEVYRGINKAFTSAPDAIRALGESYSASEEPIKAQLGRVLVQAADKDEIGRNALIFSLMQTPQYRSLMKQVIEQKKETP